MGDILRIPDMTTKDTFPRHPNHAQKVLQLELMGDLVQ